MMNSSLRRMNSEKGQALPLALLALAIGSLVIAPFLAHASSSLIGSRIYGQVMSELYSADAGVEYALWKLINGEVDADYNLTDINLTDINGMEVTVVQEGDWVETADGKLYTLKSTAWLGTEAKAEIIAQIEVTGGTVAAGGEGGDYRKNEDMVALSLIDENIIIFTTKNKSEFWGREDDPLEPGTVIDPWDLGALNMSTGKGYLFLDGDLVMANPEEYRIKGVHYYQDGGSDYLLILVRDDDTVVTVTYSSSDIIRLEVVVDESNPNNPYISAVNSIQLFDTIEGADLVALSRRDDTGTILFSMHGDAILGDEPFYRAEVVEYDPATDTYTSLFDADYILPGNPNLELDVLAVLPAPDERLLLSFTVDPVTGSNGEPILSQDIAIWTHGDPDTINLHIGMDGQMMGAGTSVSIVSWEIS